ncbi:IS110 family RNA-guided transposase [Rhizomonospora bruguierae]|uniref:IS110 family transposase n=1 Tax=Rhizomonospora bruguierae TaxID=1581705 RepID=UPI0020C024B5|nr:IS110 family transposase [Micromonospora sp. NBRC 107566]
MLYTHVAGIDVHKKQITVTVRTPDPRRPVRREKTRTFRTFYGDLLAMGSWLAELGVTRVAMESTGPYWWPVYAALRETGGLGLTIDVVNAAHVKAVPGRKTDVKDSQWLARLLEVGLLRGSFLPPDDIREIRDLTRYQTKLTEERSREKQRLLKVLEAAGIKLDVVASDTFGVSGRAMLDALVAGERDPHVLAGLARGVLRNKTDDLRLALSGRFTTHHGQMIGFHLERLDHLDQMIDQVKKKIGHAGVAGTSRRPAVAPTGLVAPFTAQIQLLSSIPGISDRVATVIISEIGVDMSRFPSAKHLAAWAGLAPGNNESAGRRRRARHRKGNTHVQSILIEAALAASRTRTRLGARFHRLHRRFGGRANNTAGKKAAFAVAHTLIKVIWAVLTSGQPYTDLGHDFYTRRINPEHHTRRLIAQLEAISGKKIILADHDGEPPRPDDSHGSEAAA